MNSWTLFRLNMPPNIACRGCLTAAYLTRMNCIDDQYEGVSWVCLFSLGCGSCAIKKCMCHIKLRKPFTRSNECRRFVSGWYGKISTRRFKGLRVRMLCLLISIARLFWYQINGMEFYADIKLAVEFIIKLYNWCKNLIWFNKVYENAMKYNNESSS